MKPYSKSRREIETAFDLPFLNPKAKKKQPQPLTEDEIKKLADKYGSDVKVRSK